MLKKGLPRCLGSLSRTPLLCIKSPLASLFRQSMIIFWPTVAFQYLRLELGHRLLPSTGVRGCGYGRPPAPNLRRRDIRVRLCYARRLVTLGSPRACCELAGTPAIRVCSQFRLQTMAFYHWHLLASVVDCL